MTAPGPRCAAVLVNYRGADDIVQAVHSIVRDDPGCEIVVVDNSVDAQEFDRLEAGLDASVRLIRAEENLGFGRACNLAWSSTQAPFVFFVNPDVRLVPGCIQALQTALECDPGLAAVAPRQFLDAARMWHLPPAWLPTALRAWSHELASRQARVARRLARAQRAENHRLWSATQPVTQRALSGGALMLRRSALPPDEPPFDPRFFMYFEDSDLCLRLRRRGLPMAIIPAAQAVHAWRNLPHKGPLMARGAQVYFDKHWPAGQRLWLDKAAALGAAPAQPGGWRFQSLLSWSVEVPAPWRKAWLLELSPSPMIQPAAGLLGAGAHAHVPAEVRESFCGSPIFGRLSPLPLARDVETALWLRWETHPMNGTAPDHNARIR